MRRPPPVRAVVVGVLCALGLQLVALPLVAPLSASAASAAARPTITTGPTGGLTDGSIISVSGSGGTPGQDVTLFECRQGDYPRGANMNAEVEYSGGHLYRIDRDCQTKPFGAKDDLRGKPLYGVYGAKGSFTTSYYALAGTLTHTQIQDPETYVSDKDVEFTCDDSSPCTLLVVDNRTYGVLASFPMTFLSPSAGVCGEPTAATSLGGGPGSLSAVYRLWATGSCATGTASPLLADYTDVGEYSGLQGFSEGPGAEAPDFALTATGFTSTGGQDVPDTRPAVYTPVATQAAVIAYQGNVLTRASNGSDIGGQQVDDLSLTLPEVAKLFGTATGATGATAPAIITRNPELAPLATNPDNIFMLSAGALATPDSATLAMTSAWAALPHSPWTAGAVRSFPTGVGKGSARVNLFANLAALRTLAVNNALDANGNLVGQVLLYLTDSATAAQLGLHVAKLQNASGAFVAPTPDSVAAAVAGMTKDATGLLVADPSVKDAKAYPLPLVEYAVSPLQAEPGARLGPLKAFLTYATTTGQAQLTPAQGVFPLPAALAQTAAGSIATIGSVTPAPAGQSSGTGGSSGLPPSTLPALPALPALPVLSLSSGAGGGLLGTAPLAGGLGTAPTAVTSPAPSGAAATPSAPATVAVPAFEAASTSPLSSALPLLGVLALALLLGGATYTSSGRPLPGALTRLGRPLGRLVGRLSRRAA